MAMVVVTAAVMAVVVPAQVVEMAVAELVRAMATATAKTLQAAKDRAPVPAPVMVAKEARAAGRGRRQGASTRSP
ncbi:hypothetical protein, partial [Chromobacterium amazonense]|uniref:hypothetical protein n=1 Tax=Chromobacterium amazonense TaxID=1382803 RepID=UPI0031F6F9E2